MTAKVIALRPATEGPAAAGRALEAVGRYLDRCKLAPNTVRAYHRQTSAYVAWLNAHTAQHPDAFVDVVGAEAAVTAWRRHLLRRKASPATVNQALAAVDLLYERAGLHIQVKRAQVPRPGEPDALEQSEQNAVERAATRRGVRDAAIIALLLYCGARVDEAARLDIDDVAITARTGSVRLHGKGDEVRDVPIPAVARERIAAWIRIRSTDPGPLWAGQRGPLTASGITQVVLAVGAAAGVQGLRPHRLRHTFATRLRQAGADPAQIQALLGHARAETTARYFRAGAAELAATVEAAFE
ncbi:tyrosine-type recombinase/integrase [Polymorphospora sp. NPDC050346]|uniref:tyrosine-type recombinase/integrase n=1 Tax=Polymorphospora sp. NPDC050346 TaxID=3155780 RepID=UPI0033C46627